MNAEQLWVLESLGHHFFEQGALDDASVVFTTVASRWPERPYAWYGLGLIDVARSDDASAADHFGRAASLGDDPRYALAQAEALLRLGNHREGADLLRRLEGDDCHEGQRARALLAARGGDGRLP